MDGVKEYLTDWDEGKADGEGEEKGETAEKKRAGK